MIFRGGQPKHLASKVTVNDLFRDGLMPVSANKINIDKKIKSPQPKTSLDLGLDPPPLVGATPPPLVAMVV